MKAIQSKTVLFITGAFVTHHCWDEWKDYFESKGFTAYSPLWPYKDAPAEDLRKRQAHDTPLANLKELIDYYANIARELPEKPIMIGHSLGDL